MRAGLGARRAWRRFWRVVSRYMPKRLYARSLIIVIAPVILLQSVIAFVFMERHWQTVTQRLSQAVTRDIAAIIDILETYPHEDGYANIIRIAQERLALRISIEPLEPLPPPAPKPFFSLLDRTLSEEITRQIPEYPFWLDTVGNSNMVEIRIRLEDKVLRVFARRSQAYASNTHIFLLWMLGTSLVLLTIAVAFLRNQIRPILQLAEAAESFGKGRPTPDFQPRGAEEVRRAGTAFLQMRERIERQIEQRTAMLTGVSHDLRTILTRFKLQLALAYTKPDIKALDQDIEDMRLMLEGYLAFARGEAEEVAGKLDLAALLGKIEEEAKLHGCSFSAALTGDPHVHVRPNAFSRLLNNVIGNAFRYSSKVEVQARHGGGTLLVTVDDDGPGIPPDKREEVFKPFVRLDEARNQDESGTGLGLSIARDIARGHGGDITLEDSPLGGLRVVIRVPA
nr:ATP-binding protein [Chelativorans sp.]